MRVITISGSAQAGKTTIANALCDKLNQQGVPTVVFNYADQLKFWAERYFHWSGKKDKEGRELLQKLGTDIARKENPDVWVSIAIEFIKTFSKIFKVVIIGDARFVNEQTKIRDNMYVDGVFTIKVERDGFDNGLTEEQKKHPSETSLDGFQFDLIIKNDKDLQSFLDKADEVVRLFNFSQKKETPVI